MSENTSDPSGDQTDADTTFDKSSDRDDTSIRALIAAQLAESDDPPPAAPSDEPAESGAETPTAIDEASPAAPQSWTEAEREVWADLPETARDAISRREKDYQAGLKSDAELQKVIEPLAQRLDGSGIHVDQYIQGLLAADAYIDQNPGQAVLTLIQRHNLRDQIADALASATSDVPNVEDSEQSRRITDLETQLAYQQQLATAQREWDAFKADHPDAEQIREVIAAKITVDPRLTYAEAYDAAKELLGGLGGTSAADIEAATIEANVQRAEKGRRLNLPKGKSDSASPPASTGNLRDDIRAAMKTAGIVR